MQVKMPSYQMITEFSVPLLFGIATALILKNGFGDVYQSITSHHIISIGDIHLSFKHIINDVFMAFFFGLAIKEIVEATRPGGCLRNPIKALNPILATLGGMIVPAAIFTILARFIVKDPNILPGTAIPIATDIAFAWLGARLVFGGNHPAIQYLLLLAILDDTLGMGVLALFYPDPEHPLVFSWLLVTLAGMFISWIFRMNGLKQWFPYILVGGTLSWIGMLNSGFHPALSLALIVPFIPGPKYDTGLFKEQEANQAPIYDFEHNMKPIIDFGLFFFGVVNAGVTISAAAFTSLTFTIFISQVLGKFIGISTTAFLAHKLGIEIPPGINYRDLRLMAMTAGVNITVSLFLADRVFGGTVYENPAKLGAILTLIVPLSILAYEASKRCIPALSFKDNNKHFVR